MMMALVHAAPTTLEPYRYANHLGVLSSPRRFYLDVEGWTWAADNDAYSAWNPDRYRTMLAAIRGLTGCLFVTAPDVVGDAEQTCELFEEWYEDIYACGQPVAFVLQDGIRSEWMPWPRLGAVFVGGTDRFKMGEDARVIVREAKRRGLWVHMGRVNSHPRVRYAKAIGCDSFDGTSLSWFRDTLLPKFLRHAASPPQMLLEEV